MADVACNFTATSYIYLQIRERQAMKKVIDALLKKGRRGLYLQEFYDRFGLSRARLGKLMWILIAIRVLNVRQPQRARIFTLNKKWEHHLNKHIGNEEFERPLRKWGMG